MATYEEKQTERSSQKILLAKVSASKRLISWVVHSGSIYKLIDFDINVIRSIEDSGIELTSVASLGAVTVGTYYHDRENKILYAHVTAGDNPSACFVTITYYNFFSNTVI